VTGELLCLVFVVGVILVLLVKEKGEKAALLEWQLEEFYFFSEKAILLLRLGVSGLVLVGKMGPVTLAL
jgi:hypothetical protein